MAQARIRSRFRYLATRDDLARSEKKCCNALPAIHARRGLRGLLRNSAGGSLLEVAIFIPLLTICAAYAAEFGYFFIVAANITSAARNAAEYSIQGYQSPGQTALPAAGPATTTSSVTALAYGDMEGVQGTSSNTTVKVCSKGVGISGNVTTCVSYGPNAGSASNASYTDPEAPTFLLNSVDVSYTINPPLPLTMFEGTLLPSLTVHRQVAMRVMD